MGTLQRHLINLDMLMADLELLDRGDYSAPSHAKLLSDIQKVLQSIDEIAKHETVSSFQKAVAASGLSAALEDKRLPGIYNRLIGYVLEYWSASKKADAIIANQFDAQADRRLDLLQVKSIKAKSQFKTVARAMGLTDYQRFIESFGLQHPDWQWDGHS